MGRNFIANKPPRESLGEQAAPASPLPDDQAPKMPEAVLPSPPDYVILDGGRLSIDAGSLPDSGSVSLGLALGADALGDEPLKGVIVSTQDGRTLELITTPDVGMADGAGLEGGVRIEVEEGWLTPGAYMIQIRTAEKSQFPIRRYVLEVN